MKVRDVVVVIHPGDLHEKYVGMYGEVIHEHSSTVDVRFKYPVGNSKAIIHTVNKDQLVVKSSADPFEE